MFATSFSPRGSAPGCLAAAAVRARRRGRGRSLWLFALALTLAATAACQPARPPEPLEPPPRSMGEEVVAESAHPSLSAGRLAEGTWSVGELVYLGEEPWGPTPTKAPFAVRYADELSRYNSNFAVVMPGETLEIEAGDRNGSGRFVLRTFGGKVENVGLRRWTWRAPATPGAEIPLLVRDIDSGESLRIVVFVLVPASRIVGGVLNGYTIGRYATDFPWETDEYDPPAGYIELTEERMATEISPTFSLGEFACKQEGDFPKYLVLRPRLLHKLEFLRERFLERGFRADKLTVMSGYRTPAYNRELGSARLSRHMYGSAADIFIDARPPEGWHDDLNRDGRIDTRDVGVLYDIVEHWTEAPGYVERFVGGLARYRANRWHGPFLHVDVRKVRARW